MNRFPSGARGGHGTPGRTGLICRHVVPSVLGHACPHDVAILIGPSGHVPARRWLRSQAAPFSSQKVRKEGAAEVGDLDQETDEATHRAVTGDKLGSPFRVFVPIVVRTTEVIVASASASCSRGMPCSGPSVSSACRFRTPAEPLRRQRQGRFLVQAPGGSPRSSYLPAQHLRGRWR